MGDVPVEVSNNFIFTNVNPAYKDQFTTKPENRQAGSYKELQAMTPDECNLAFEDDISITFVTSVLEIVDDIINFFTFGLWGWFFNMREAYAHSTLSALAGAQSYLNCYVPNSLVYSTEPSKATS